MKWWGTRVSRRSSWLWAEIRGLRLNDFCFHLYILTCLRSYFNHHLQWPPLYVIRVSYGIFLFNALISVQLNHHTELFLSLSETKMANGNQKFESDNTNTIVTWLIFKSFTNSFHFVYFISFCICFLLELFFLYLFCNSLVSFIFWMTAFLSLCL